MSQTVLHKHLIILTTKFTKFDSNVALTLGARNDTVIKVKEVRTGQLVIIGPTL